MPTLLALPLLLVGLLVFGRLRLLWWLLFYRLKEIELIRVDPFALWAEHLVRKKLELLTQAKVLLEEKCNQCLEIFRSIRKFIGVDVLELVSRRFHEIIIRIRVESSSTL